MEEGNLREKFNVTKDRLKSRVDTCFRDNKTSKTTCLIQEKASVDTLNAIQYVMGFIVSREAFSQHAPIEQLIQVIKVNKIIVGEDVFRLQSNKITLCVLLLLHNSEFDFKGYKYGYCRIEPEKN